MMKWWVHSVFVAEEGNIIQTGGGVLVGSEHDLSRKSINSDAEISNLGY